MTSTVLAFASPHGLQTGQAVEYGTTGVAIGGLTPGVTYYAIVLDPNHIELADSFADAQAGVALPLDLTRATGTQSLTPPKLDVNAATTTRLMSVAGAYAAAVQKPTTQEGTATWASPALWA